MHHPFCHLPAMPPPPHWAIYHATTLPCCRARLAILFSSPCTLPLRLPHKFQIHKTADNAFEASTPSRRQRECGYGSSSCARSRSPPRPTSSRKRRRSRSPKYEQVSPSERFEKRSRDGTQRVRRDKLEFFSIRRRPTWRSLHGLSRSPRTHLLKMRWHQAMGWFRGLGQEK